MEKIDARKLSGNAYCHADDAPFCRAVIYLSNPFYTTATAGHQSYFVFKFENYTFHYIARRFYVIPPEAV